MAGLLDVIQQGQNLARGIIPPSVPLGAGGPPLVPAFGGSLPSTAVSTRFPTAVGRVADPLKTPLMSGDLPAYLSDKIAPHNIGLLSTYPGMSFLKGMPTNEAAAAAVKRMSENMTHLFERSPKVMQEVSPQWYFGGSRLVSSWAERHGVPKQSVAAATAVLSPRQNWDENVSMAERTADILFTKGKMPFSTAMTNKAKEIYTKPDQKSLLREIKGKRLDDLETAEQKAAWIRLYDEAHNPVGKFRTIAPDGGLGPFKINDDGTPAKMAWQTNSNITKAVRALESGGNMEVISPLLGGKHKVRNFYNNLMHPELMIGSTGDTHQVGAGLLMPVGANDPAVLHNLLTNPKTPAAKAALEKAGYQGAKGSAISGFQGTYPIIENATRVASENIGILPHMAQSGTWEPVRTLFSDKTAGQKAVVGDIWRQVDKGLLKPERARDIIIKQSGGIKLPGWVTGGLLFDPRFARTY